MDTGQRDDKASKYTLLCRGKQQPEGFGSRLCGRARDGAARLRRGLAAFLHEWRKAGEGERGRCQQRVEWYVQARRH
jgi:hypothetical protein